MANSGRLKVHCFLGNTYLPISDVKILIYYADTTRNTQELVKVVNTNREGYVDNIELEVPDTFSSSGEPTLLYGVYNLELSRDGYRSLIVRGVQVFPNRIAIQRCYLEKGFPHACSKVFIEIPEHKQIKQQCSKIAPQSLTTLRLKKEEKHSKKSKSDKNMRVLSSVEVPSVITVHAGDPYNKLAPNYTLDFVDYIKNVGSSELYPTWNSDSLRANIYCIVSFALNRVYTEWYRSQGFDFDITSDTAYDQAFNYGRNTYNTINVIADQLFKNYLQRPGEEAPFLSEFCNGTTSTCPGWLSQWGSQYLGENGYTPYEILTYYYGSNLNILEAQTVKGYPVSFPGYPIGLWMEGNSVKAIQNQLNEIAVHYPAIPKLTVDGIYGPKTENSVKIFQGIFDLPNTGIVNSATWYSISRVYVGVTGIAN
ncbi:peptidoglycan-binding domain-containing protein [Clostridium massiliamazoniense]|uniref:peptidoglycan-binding domain-containing protein n=1 Tax=Clostridium massiliamazoniense TaxID=1347366 RepID=UPI0006D792C0|nr:peptidoglycan-binding domain-containing protein [Clostridium massiliamazoniense]